MGPKWPKVAQTLRENLDGPKWPKIPASHHSPQNFKSTFFLGHPVHSEHSNFSIMPPFSWNTFWNIWAAIELPSCVSHFLIGLSPITSLPWQSLSPCSLWVELLDLSKLFYGPTFFLIYFPRPFIRQTHKLLIWKFILFCTTCFSHQALVTCCLQLMGFEPSPQQVKVVLISNPKSYKKSESMTTI